MDTKCSFMRIQREKISDSEVPSGLLMRGHPLRCTVLPPLISSYPILTPTSSILLHSGRRPSSQVIIWASKNASHWYGKPSALDVWPQIIGLYEGWERLKKMTLLKLIICFIHRLSKINPFERVILWGAYDCWEEVAKFMQFPKSSEGCKLSFFHIAKICGKTFLNFTNLRLLVQCKLNEKTHWDPEVR